MVLFPNWKDLPELDLYLDQVLLYVNTVNQKAFPEQEKVLTAAMINNYVKHGQIQKPIKKKYNRTQIARLITLTTLKPVFPIQDIIETVEFLVTNEESSETFYNQFVMCMRDEKCSTSPHPVVLSACQTVKLYHQTRQLVLDLKGEMIDEPNL